MRVEVLAYPTLPSRQLDEWRTLRYRVHPRGVSELGSDLSWAPLDESTDQLVGLWDGSALRSCAWITKRTIAVDERRVRVAGVRGVMTDPARRRRGYVAVPFYVRLGWRAVTGPVFCEQRGLPW